jgi:hypothetical protein
MIPSQYERRLRKPGESHCNGLREPIMDQHLHRGVGTHQVCGAFRVGHQVWRPVMRCI